MDSQYQLEKIIDWAAYLEHFQAVFKEFNTNAAHSNNLLISYFQDGLRPSIRAQINEHDKNLENWPEVIKWAIDVKTKAGQQLFCLLRESNTHCLQSHRQIKDKKSKDQKNSETEKIVNNSSTNQSIGQSGLSDKASQSRQALGCLAKKDFRLHHKGYPGQSQGQNSNTLAININTPAVKKGKKVKVDLSQIEYYSCYKQDHYVNKYPNKEPKN